MQIQERLNSNVYQKLDNRVPWLGYILVTNKRDTFTCNDMGSEENSSDEDDVVTTWDSIIEKQRPIVKEENIFKMSQKNVS